MAFLAKHKLAIGAGAAVVAYLLWRRSRGAAAGETRVGRPGVVELLFDPVDASDAPVGFDDFGNPLITRPSQL
jgi:hypothetical protein